MRLQLALQLALGVKGGEINDAARREAARQRATCKVQVIDIIFG